MKEIKILLLYPPEQSWPGTMVKPNGSLAYPYLGRALRDIDVETYIYDAWNACYSEEFKSLRKSWQAKSNFKNRENKSSTT